MACIWKKLKPPQLIDQTTAITNILDGGSGWDYDVFLNFRGPDCRHTVVDVLYSSLTSAGIHAFRDDEELRKGETISGELLRAISNSRIYILIFSKGYASSRWCLHELEKIMECQKSSSGKTKKAILPVFYDVDVNDDMKLRREVYTKALKEHRRRLGKAVVKRWADALENASKIKGWNLKDHGLDRLAGIIVKQVFDMLNISETAPVVPDNLVGIHDRIEDIMRLLDEGSPKVRFLVIHGLGGIGKTTLAKSVYKKISHHFQGSCILSDIRSSSSVGGMVKLQEELLFGTLNLKSIKFFDIDHGIDMIRRRLCSQKVLIILDDVDRRDHLENLAAKSDWFGSKSRIIITTRNIEFLPVKDKEYYFYEMKELNHGHALQLFCRHAFKNDSSPLEYRDISTKIVAAIGGLPLAIQVIGSSLYNQDYGWWKFTLEKLKGAHQMDVQENLMISYQALEYEQQQIFLDIACFFNNEKKMDPIYFWEACKLHPDSGIEILVRRSLIKINDGDVLWMHDQLRDLGRAIAQSKSQGLKTNIAASHRRLWSPEDAINVLGEKKVAQCAVALKLGTLDASCTFAPEEFAGLSNLNFLELQGGNFEGDFKNVFQELRWLSWFDCPLEIKAANLSFKNLVVLKLSGFQITNDWGGWGPITVAKHLKVLHFIDCTCMVKTHGLSAFRGLERLTLKSCLRLEKIDESISELRGLDYLEISNGSRNLKCNWHHFTEYSQVIPPQPQLLQGSIGGLKSLTVLKLNNVGLTELHPSIGELPMLKHLVLRCPHLGNLPKSIGKLVSLVELDISFSGIKKLPYSIGELRWLTILRMDNSKILHLPDSIGRLESLNELHLPGTKSTALPKTIEKLLSLKVLDMRFTLMRKLPKALGKVENLEELYASECVHMDGELPEEIGKLSSLRILNLRGTKVSRVPTSISQLFNLQELVLGEFCEPLQLPKLPASLESLEVSFSSLVSHRIPDLSNMTNLVTLKLLGGSSSKSQGTSQPHVQAPKMEWLTRLAKLEELTLVLYDLILPPVDLSSLSKLWVLDISCVDPQSLTHLPSGLESLTLHDVESRSEWQLFSHLNNLFTLVLHKCWYREIWIDGLGQLKNLHLQNMKLENCELVEVLSNLSCLKELRRLEIVNCPCLVEIRGLEEVESLRLLWLESCCSIQCLPDLSNLKLEELRFVCCESLQSIPNVGEETPCYLTVSSCMHFDDFEGPYKKQAEKKEN